MSAADTFVPVPVSGWGRFPRVEAVWRELRHIDEARDIVARNASLIARGNGRSYGDAALNRSCILSTRRSDRILAFDRGTGRITAESGLLLADLIAFALPYGFFPPVVPGTKFVTLGGMIASDVHGKSHHKAGSFGCHVDEFLLLTADGSARRCVRGSKDGLFEATCGGMGLTGLILEATLRLMPVETASIRQETVQAANLEEAIALCDESVAWTYSVAWIDCLGSGDRLGRALIHRGEHARAVAPGATPRLPPQRRSRRVPCDLPRAALNPLVVRAFNGLHYRRAKIGMATVDYERFFFPLDGVLDWNRCYGRSGFTQYQCVVPRLAGAAALAAILRRVSAAGEGSFLAVLKQFGAEGEGLLSFPMEGFTLALDFPLRAGTLALLDELDAIVADHGGRLYLAKDARAGAAMMRRTYPRLDRFKAVRAAADPGRKFASLQSRRLDL